MQERNISLDYLKLVLSILVITIHVPDPFGSTQWISWPIQNGLARIAVPIFFIMNGFYLYPILGDKVKVKKYLLRLVLLYAVWMIIYRPFYAGDDHYRTLQKLIFGYTHLWYIAALIPTVAVLYFCKKWKLLNDGFLIFSFALYLLGFFMQKMYAFDIEIVPIEMYGQATRNFVMPSLFFVYLGYYIHDKGLMQRIHTNNKTIAAIVILCLLLMAESYFTLIYSLPSDYYLVLPVLCPLIFMVVYQKGKVGKYDKQVRDLSTAVYFSHVLVIKLLESSGMFYQSALCIMALFFSLVVSIALVRLNNELKFFL